MKTVEVITENCNWVTEFNGTDDDAVNYFLGNQFNVGQYPDEKMETVIECVVDGKTYK